MKQLLYCLMLSCLLMLAYSSRSQNITNAEYFFDTDPGFGSGTAITISPAANISGLVFNANVASLHTGMHTLYVRSKDATNKWSITNYMYVVKVQSPFSNPYTAGNIIKAEYFYDTDPGFGNGTDIPVTAATDINNLVFNANVSSLHGGMHTLYVRTKTAGSGWSISNSMIFAKVQGLFGNPYTTSNITKAEYFYDADPGLGNGTDIPVTAATNINGLLFNANVSALHSGVHVLYVRTKDAQGKWAITNNLSFVKIQSLYPNTYTAGNIVKMEYFFNTDPGIGNGIDIPVAASADINGFVANIPITSLGSGLYIIYIRTKDDQGRWSITNTHQFSKIQGLSGSPYSQYKIVKAEYFFDTDPGFGNGSDIPVTPANDLSGLVFNANVAPLHGGMHNLYVRTKDSTGQWSISNFVSFVKVQSLYPNPYTTSNINKLEYFYDTDPGFGNGTDIPVTPADNISGLVFNANVSGLHNGVHTLLIRSRDAQGKWSVVNTTVFAKIQNLYASPYSASNISRIEYFIDTDPGFGNGISVPFTTSTDVSALAFNVDMTIITNTDHKLYVRTKDLQGKWSITNIHAFNGGLIPLAIKLVSFEALLQKDNSVLLEWITEQENDVDYYTIERSYDAIQWTLVGNKEPQSASSNERHTYQMKDEQPGTGIVYYRLTETDLNGKTTQAPIRFVKITNAETIAGMVFPNPNDGKQLNIKSAIFKEGEVTVTIAGADGKLYFRQTVNDVTISVFTINDLNLVSGNYFIQLQGKDKSDVLKLVVADVN